MSRASVASGSGFGIGGLDKSLPSSEPNLSVQDKDETPLGKIPRMGQLSTGSQSGCSETLEG